MTGFNLPPGCNVSDLPGNTKADQQWEALFDSIYEQFPPSLTDENEKETLADWIAHKIADAYGDGYQQACSDQKEADGNH